MVRFQAHFDGSVLVPDEPVQLPTGNKLLVSVEPVTGTEKAGENEKDWFETALELAETMPGNLPEDLAEQHDHYIHGTPKR